MDEDLAAYIDGIPAEQRPLFDRLHTIVLGEHPDAAVALSYGMAPMYSATLPSTFNRPAGVPW